MKVDVMTEVFEILKKGQGTDTDIEALSNKEKFLIISALKKKYSILSLLKQLSMSKSSYYYVEQITQGMAVLSLTYPMKESTRPL